MSRFTVAAVCAVGAVLGRGIGAASAGAGAGPVRLLQGRRRTALPRRSAGRRPDAELPKSPRKRSHCRLCERVEEPKGPLREVITGARAQISVPFDT
jgi:hypothetical protein